MSNENASRTGLGSVRSSRRTFLKASGLAAAASALAPAAVHAGEPAAVSQATSEAGASVSLVEMINVLQGTQSTPVFSYGNTLPIAATPFGMAHWTVQTQANSPWMFQPWSRRTQGFRCTHQLSPWLSDYGFATFLPVLGKVNPEAGARASSYIPEQARLSPYRLELNLTRYRAKIELVPTERCCVLTASYAAPDPAAADQAPGFIIDVPSVQGEVTPAADRRSVQFACNQTSGGTPANFATYYVLKFPEAWKSIEMKARPDGAEGRLISIYFQESRNLEARIGTSFISFEQALYNLEQEVGASAAADIQQSTMAKWNEMLSRIELEGATAEQARTFYSCLYRALLFPRTFHEPVPNGTGVHHYSAFNGKIEPGVMYADHGYWDVYRAWYPLASILFPEKLSEILQGWVNALKEGGWFPQFPAPGYRACMSGSLIDSLFADAVVKGIGSFDRETAFEGLKKHATQPGDPAKGYGRVGVEEYMKLHYVPADKIPQSVAETADAAYGDFCIAQIAKVLGKQKEHEYFMGRSEYWRNVYDREVGFFRGKNSDGSWLAPFDSFTWGSPYEEGSAWQHRWDAPHAVPGLIEAIGGKQAAVKALDDMLSVPAMFHVGVYGQEIHEMSEMAAVPFGQYAQSNQPSHHLLYLFAHAGRPDRLQFWVRRVMAELYSPDSFPGDEDTGSMAAWYILSSMGLYQVCPGVPEYTLGSPLFPGVKLHLPGGKTLHVQSHSNSEQTVYVRKVAFNGEQRAGITLQHSELIAGGTLSFEMAATGTTSA
jgi:predicted alpha-1,2-mannosidase